MNTPMSPRPRLVCRAVRQWCALVDGASPRHVTTCSDCQAFYAANDELESRLRRDAGQLARLTPAVSDHLESRILRAVRNSTPASEPAQAPAWRGTWVMAATAAAVAIGMGVFYRDAGPQETTTLAEVEVLSEAVESVSRGLVETVIPSAGALVADNPLQREFDSIFGDARAALGFLALNFLPGANATAPNSSPVSPRPI